MLVERTPGDKGRCMPSAPRWLAVARLQNGGSWKREGKARPAAQSGPRLPRWPLPPALALRLLVDLLSRYTSSPQGSRHTNHVPVPFTVRGVTPHRSSGVSSGALLLDKTQGLPGASLLIRPRFETDRSTGHTAPCGTEMANLGRADN